ncbi:MAG TPA: DNA-3-methyladenine glycosylase [Candidatus Accumulibacter phosphatis]|nr:MAG: DNA-3-methyladenine glycosylase [Candidatus Accumulibacter sp. SK-11]HAY28095.1 DNA-3-methyladenine glycosylase 2 family protein [Accumulibacter sp.]HRL76958.1 DNA-3-methyladenine glycosylase [Candidatus Accumulibacter phosphatis]HCN67610.1 DNA-3-methyladenine glycosylase 2 family protein [Accumulibacter sp.]HCV12589.1 DNA-3-methyladenine glycosylase 2 family protein [Accumulibacter sp.]
MTPGYWQQASGDLALADPVLGSLVERFAGMALVSRGDPFVTLLRSIVGQQISVKAADSIWRRLQVVVAEITPASVLACEHASLRGCGLSARKVEYLVDLARHFASGQLDVEHWSRMSDGDLVAELTRVRGIGVWTAEMFLIFNQLRPDVLPLDDLGLQRAVAIHYHAGERPPRRVLVEHGERWRPWRSVATWYLWRSLDPLPVEY